MGGTTIDNWKSFETNMFKNIDDPNNEQVREVGDLAGKIDSVKAAYVEEPSTLKYVLKTIFSAGIYNLVNYFREKNQSQTLAAVKSGIDNVHNAMSLIAAKRAELSFSESTHKLSFAYHSAEFAWQ
jgi:hypothetical protein